MPRLAIERGLAVDRPGAGQRARRHVGVKACDRAGAPGLLVDEVDLAADDAHLFQNDGARRNVGAAAAQPVERAVGQQADARLRLLDAHVEDTRLARQQGRKLGIHGKPCHMHQRLAVGICADSHVMQGDRGKGQQARLDLAEHGHLLAEHTARLALEILAEIGPVDEQRRQQRSEQRDDQQPAEENQYASEHVLRLPSLPAQR